MNNSEEQCKKWSIKTIVSCIYSEGMAFMARREMKQIEADKFKRIMVKEIKSRIK